jgi:hypothetical protein
MAEVGDPTLFIRRWGTSYDPHRYLEEISEHVDRTGLAGFEAIALRDDRGPAPALERHLAQRPARLLVTGADRAPSHVVGDVFRTAPVPLVVVNDNG